MDRMESGNRRFGSLHPKGRKRSPAKQPRALKSNIRTRPREAPLSSLSVAFQLTKKAARLGFDWPNLGGVLRKFDEEMQELRDALSLQRQKSIREEIGDLLFVLVNISRFLRVDPEKALQKTVQKFRRRFHHMETSLCRDGTTFRQTNLVDFDRLWEEAKKTNIK